MTMNNLTLCIASIILAGCASTKATPQQTLFEGRYANAVAVLDQNGCDVHAMNKCDYSDTIVAFSTNREVGGTRLTQGPQAAWRDVDQLRHLKASVVRSGSAPVVGIERINVESACAATIAASVDHASKLILPACGQYPEIRVTWRTVSPFERLGERWTTSLGLLLTAIGGGELP